jgi:hypothetical protein
VADEAIAIDPSRRRKFLYTDADLDLAQWMYERIVQLHARFKKPHWPTWANDIRLMRDIDKRTRDEIKSVFAWANNDSFWCTNILSPAKLRKQFDRLVIQLEAHDKRRGNKGEAAQLAHVAMRSVHNSREVAKPEEKTPAPRSSPEKIQEHIAKMRANIGGKK